MVALEEHLERRQPRVHAFGGGIGGGLFGDEIPIVVLVHLPGGEVNGATRGVEGERVCVKVCLGDLQHRSCLLQRGSNRLAIPTFEHVFLVDLCVLKLLVSVPLHVSE